MRLIHSCDKDRFAMMILSQKDPEELDFLLWILFGARPHYEAK